MSIFEELKRRNVFKVGVAYAVVAWLLLQVIVVVLPTFNAPQWVTQTLMFAIFLGFPLALLLAWAFELTPEGIKLTTEVDPDTSIRPHTGQRINILIISALSLAVLFLLMKDYVFDDVTSAQATTPVADNTIPAVQSTEAEASAQVALAKSIAVLPFTNLSNDADQDYFADGLTDELINKLSQVNDLQVTGRNSSFYFKGRNDALKDIGQVLGVAHLLQGSVRKSGTQLRINAQLLDVASNANLWSQSFDAQLSDIFTVQDEIAAAVTTALSVTLRAGEFSQPGMTGNVEAYDEYLQGYKRYVDASNGQGSLLDAIAHLERATTLDPAFAMGWLLQFEAYRYGLAVLPPSQTSDFAARLQNAAARAAALVPEHPALLQIEAARLITQEQNYAAAERLLLPLLDTTINTNADMAREYARLLWSVGRVEDALRYAQQARRLDPIYPLNSFYLASLLLTLDREAETLAEIERGLTLVGAAQFISGLKFIAALQAGDKTAALAASAHIPGAGAGHSAIADLWRDAGDAAALSKLRELVDAGDFGELLYVVYREWAVTLGDPQLGLDLLNLQDSVRGDIWLPLYRDIRALPGFKDYVREKGLLDYWRATGNWGDYCRPVADDFECE